MARNVSQFTVHKTAEEMYMKRSRTREILCKMVLRTPKGNHIIGEKETAEIFQQDC